MEELVNPAANFWGGKRVLVTGHTGFKGAWLSLWLHRMGARVFGLSLPADEPSLFAAAALDTVIDTTHADIRDRTRVEREVDRISPQIVFHLAAQPLVRLSYDDPVATYATNVMGTVHVLAAAARTPSVRTIVVVTSDKCYENREGEHAFREDDPLGGHDPYSSSKACAELVTAAWRRSFFEPRTEAPIGIASVRAGNVIGGGDWAPDRLVPDSIRALAAGQPIGIRNPHSTRPWQFVLEPLCGYLLLAERLWQKPAAFGEAWNFGPGPDDSRPVSWIASRIVELWGGDARWQASAGDGKHEAGRLSVDAAKARARLGWAPRLEIGAALEWTVEWYRACAEGASPRKMTDDQIARFANLAPAGSV